MFTQIDQTPSDSSNRHKNSLARVSSLLSLRCPLAVFFAIGAIVIFAFNGKSGRLLSHVSQEVLPLEPSLTDGDSAPAIILENGAFGIKAPLEHLLPNVISFARGLAVNSVTTTSTTGIFGEFQPRIIGTTSHSAIAYPITVGFSPTFGRVARYQKLAEPASNQGFFSLWHNSAFPLLCFRGGSRYCSRDSLLYYETGDAIYQG